MLLLLYLFRFLVQGIGLMAAAVAAMGFPQDPTRKAIAKPRTKIYGVCCNNDRRRRRWKNPEMRIGYGPFLTGQQRSKSSPLNSCAKLERTHTLTHISNKFNSLGQCKQRRIALSIGVTIEGAIGFFRIFTTNRKSKFNNSSSC